MYGLKQYLARIWNDESGIIVLVSVVVFVAVMVLLHIHSLFERRSPKGADGHLSRLPPRPPPRVNRHTPPPRT